MEGSEIIIALKLFIASGSRKVIEEVFMLALTERSGFLCAFHFLLQCLPFGRAPWGHASHAPFHAPFGTTQLKGKTLTRMPNQF